MDENVVHHHMVLPENFLVQPVGNVPVSMVDYGKIQMAQFIHSGPFCNRPPVIQFSEVNSNPPLSQIHPLELEIERDFQTSQQQHELDFSNQSTDSVMHASTQTVEEVCVDDSSKSLAMANIMYDGTFIPLPTVSNMNESIVNMDGLNVQDGVFYHPVIKQLIVDKGQYFVVPQTQVLFNNVLNDDQNNVTDVPETGEQFKGSEEEEEETEVVSPSEFNECENNLKNEETVSYSHLNEHDYNVQEGEGGEDDEEEGEEQAAKETDLNPQLNIVDSNTKEDASISTNLIKHNTSSQTKEEEPAELESESDENCAPNNDYESNLDPPTPENAPNVENCTGPEKSHTCHICNNRFGLRKNMYFHLRKVHNIQPVIEGGILCPICKEKTTKQEYLRNHLESVHGIQIEKEEKLFNALNDFLVWKAQVEKETLSSYISKSSSKLLANNEQKTYYRCHRSGSYTSLKIRKKRLKDHGSNKMGATCPAAMEVTENKTGINVIFWKTHVGHNLELSRLPLTKDDRAEILDHLNCGSPVSEIVQHFQSESSMNPPTKLCLLTKQDVRNVKKVYELECNPEGPKPIQEKTLNTPSPESIIEKADILWELLETTDVKAEFRSKVCLMLDNLISLVKRRGERVSRRESMTERRKDRLKRNEPDITDQNDHHSHICQGRQSLVQVFGNCVTIDVNELLLPYVVLRNGDLYYMFEGGRPHNTEQYSLI